MGRKPRIDPVRVRFLSDVLRTETDEAKRRTAILELAEADPRTNPEVMTSLIGALKRDSASVRAVAAEVIGRFKAVFPSAGAALESAAESDPSPAVREAAKQALWEYHLNGYRSPKGGDPAAMQTAEPPLALPAYQRPPVAVAPPAPVPVAIPAPVPALPNVVVRPVVPATPVPVASRVGPTVSGGGKLNPTRELVSRVATRSGSTVEPPLAKRIASAPPPPAVETEPPIIIHRPDVSVYGKRPAIYVELPPIVSPPGAMPGTVPLPGPTSEPPFGKTAAR
jgi:hypothetical protein